MAKRKKSMQDIKEQYTRIQSRMYRNYLDNPNTPDDYYDKGMARVNKIYDRYERNIARQQGLEPRRGISNVPTQLGGTDDTIKYSRSAYAGNGG